MTNTRCADCKYMEVVGNQMRCATPLPWALDTDDQRRLVALSTAFVRNDCRFFCHIEDGDSHAQ